MADIKTLPLSVAITLAVLLLITLWCGFFLYGLQVRSKVRRYKRIVLLGILLLILIYIQILVDIRFKNISYTSDFLSSLVKCPIGFYYLAFVLIIAAVLLLFRDYILMLRNNITNMSIKASIDKLPTGICVYTEAGIPVIVNLAMDRISREYLGGPIFSGRRLYDSLVELSEDGTNILKTGDGNVYSFEKHQINIENRVCYELTVSDVTNEYNINQQLIRDNERLQEMNLRMRELNKTIDKVSLEEEILDAKVRVHDNLGQVLLATKLYLTGSDESLEYERVLDMWRESMDFLHSIPDRDIQDEYANLWSVAEDVGVKLKCTGELPRDKERQHIVATAIHECMTNTLRHADGDEVYISVENYDRIGSKVIITNNGNVPSRVIEERGGLAHLRHLVESSGGEMIIESSPDFKLIISL